MATASVRSLPMTDAFYVPDGDRFAPTAWTRGPWEREAQHAGPPAALVARAIEGLEPAGQLQVARFTFEVLRPIPLTELRIEARVVRPEGGCSLPMPRCWTSAGRWPGPACGRSVLPLSRSPQPARNPHRSTRPSTRRRNRCSIRPGKARATSPRWSGGDPEAPSSSRARRQCGCARESHRSQGRSPRR
jgi:hypothetical protein